MALNLRQLRLQLRDTAALVDHPTIAVEAIDEGNASGSRPWQAFRVLAVDVDSEKNPTSVQLVIRPIPGAHG